MLPSFASQRVTILRPVYAVEWGHSARVPGSWVEETVRCAWEGANMGANGTSAGGFEAAMGSRSVYLSPGVSISAQCRLKFDDDPEAVWEIIGEPAKHRSPTGAVSHIAITARRWEAVN